MERLINELKPVQIRNAIYESKMIEIVRAHLLNFYTAESDPSSDVTLANLLKIYSEKCTRDIMRVQDDFSAAALKTLIDLLNFQFQELRKLNCRFGNKQ